MTNNKNESLQQLQNRLRIVGITVSILMLWNGVGDYIYAYSAKLNGMQYFSPLVWDIIITSGNRPHWMIMIAQTAGWLYPIYALSYFHWWIGMRQAGFWLATMPCAILAYALFMVGGIQHAGWAFLSVLEQAKAVTGCTDNAFYNIVNRYILEHFFIGDLTAILALTIGPIWHAIGILSGKTIYPRWMVLLSPLGVLITTMLIGALLPAPFAGFLIALFGTWYMLIPTIASTVWLWNIESKEA